jgi:nucleotide-binding universal stress UspA family protein
MKKILVPVDGSGISLKAADEAIKIAQKFDSEVTFVSVVEVKMPFYGAKPISASLIKMQNELEIKATNEYEKLLNALIEKYKGSGLVLHKRILTGPVDMEIEDYAGEDHSDLIVMGKRGMSPGKRFLVGSTTKKVLATAPCSVLVVKE